MSERIVTLLKDAELRAGMGREARRVFKETFSMTKYGQDIERLYYEALERDRRLDQ